MQTSFWWMLARTKTSTADADLTSGGLIYWIAWIEIAYSLLPNLGLRSAPNADRKVIPTALAKPYDSLTAGGRSLAGWTSVNQS